MKNWDKILDDFARKCKGGAPDMTNSRHLALLRESLIKFGWNENATNEFIGNLREGETVLDKKVLNPDTGRKIKVRSALRYDKSTSVYQAAAAMIKQSTETDDGEISFEPKKKKEIPTSPTLEDEQVGKVQGNTEQGDNQVKNDMLEHGFDGYKDFAKENDIKGKDGKPAKPAPGSAGSAFNEIVTGQGVEILEENPEMTAEELAIRNYNQFGRTELGHEQSLTAEIPDEEYPPEFIENIKITKQNEIDYIKKVLGLPDDWEYNPYARDENTKAFKAKRKELEKNAKESNPTAEGSKYKELLDEIKQSENEKAVMSKCIVSAKSAKSKSDTSKSRTKKLQEKGLMGENTKTESFYGAEDSIDGQVDAINKADKVLLPNGQVVDKQDAIDFVRAGGGGANPSDTATFVSDEEGNLMIQFHSDKTTTNDIQDNSTLKKEEANYRAKVDEYFEKGSEEHTRSNKIIDEYTSEIDELEEQYNDISKPIATRLQGIPLSEQTNLIAHAERISKLPANKQKSDPHYNHKLSTIHNNVDAAVMGKNGVKSQYVKYIPKGADPNNLTLEQKYSMIRAKVAAGEGEPNDSKVIIKIGNQLAKDKGQKNLNSDGAIGEVREKVVDLQRKRVEKLNELNAPNGKPLGEQLEAEETIRGFHLGLMDERDYEPPNPDMSDEEKQKTQGERFKGILNNSFDVLMGGTRVDGETLRNCMSVTDTKNFKDEFTLQEEEEYQYADKEKTQVTGKTVFRYALDKDGRKFPIGYKKYRPKAGKLGKTNNTFNYSAELQECFKTGTPPKGK